jgi:cytoskeleton protein RodZ
MTNETNNMNTDKKSISYGAKLKAAREAMGLEQKDLAAQLRLGERIIEMLESGHYASDLPITFIRGYIRSYSKLLQIPESEIAAALEPIKPAPAPQDASPVNKQPSDLTSSNYYMQFSTYAIVVTLTGMIGLWWYNHTPAQNPVVAESQTLAIPQQVTAEAQSSIATPNTAPAQQNNASTAANQPQQMAANTTAATTQQPTGAKLASATHSHHAVAADENDDDEDNNNTD